MEIGWVDFSREDRNKVLSVIDLLSENATLDELGVAPIRDGFANIFFPGTSTIQTRAKYFLIVPYALLDLEKTPNVSPHNIRTELDRIERQCGEILRKSNEFGVIGSRSLSSGGWVKRTPAEIYWSGLRRFGIFSDGNMSLQEYVRTSCFIKGKKANLRKLGNSLDEGEGSNPDDEGAGMLFTKSFWTTPPHTKAWMDTLTISLTSIEADYLKNRITSFVPDCMMAHILKYSEKGITDLPGFIDLGDGAINGFPEYIQADYWMARDFSEFIFIARIRYNIMLSQGRNEEANEAWRFFSQELVKIAGIDIDAIMNRLRIINPPLRGFLMDIQRYMLTGDINAMDERIYKRECQLKGPSRAKLSRAGEFPVDSWFGGGFLDYRFSNAMRIINDIFDAED